MATQSVSVAETAAQRVRQGFLSERQRALLADLIEAVDDYLHDDIDEDELGEAFQEAVDDLIAGPPAPAAVPE